METRNNLTQQEMVAGWLDRLVLQLEKKIVEYNAIDTGTMRQEMQTGLSASDGIVNTARLAVKFYMRFVDMGVGRGVPLGGRQTSPDVFGKYRNAKGQLNKYRRKAKPVYSKPLAGQIYRLQELLLEFYGIKSIQVLESPLQNLNININL